MTKTCFTSDLDSFVNNAWAKGVRPIIVTGISVRGSQDAFRLTERYPDMYSTAGVHPHNASQCDDKTIFALEQLAMNPKVVAIGECGLDFNRNFSPQQVQEHWFREQVKLAVKLKKPLFLHEREAHVSLVKILSEFVDQLPPVVMHCFTGTEAEIIEYVKLGFYIGFTGVICNRKRGEHLRSIIRKRIIPLDKIMIETDAPFMNPPQAPTTENEPANLIYVLETLAESLEDTQEHIANITTANSCRFFSLPSPETK